MATLVGLCMEVPIFPILRKDVSFIILIFWNFVWRGREIEIIFLVLGGFNANFDCSCLSVGWSHVSSNHNSREA